MQQMERSMRPEWDALAPGMMPFNPADPQCALQRGLRPYSVVEILREVFHEDFSEKLKIYLRDHPVQAAEAIGVPGAEDFRLCWLSAPRVESTLDQPICSMAVDLVFRATVEVSVPPEWPVPEPGQWMERKRFRTEYRMRYVLSPQHRRCSVPIVGPACFFPEDEITAQKHEVTNQYLLPVMRAEDYPVVAGRMLKRYFPEALQTGQPVDGWAVARRMGLQVRRVRFEEGSAVQGRVYFDRTVERLRDRDGNSFEAEVEPMTVLINADLCTTPETETSTLIHECCHVYLNLPFFLLQMLGGRPVAPYSSRTRQAARRDPGQSSPVGWMELQAEKLPAYIMMEETAAKREIERLLALRGGRRTPLNMYWVMEKLAARFRVSRAMARVRMMELGYPEAEGIYSYLDGVRIPDYGCAEGWKPGVTYVISRADAGALLRESAAFAGVLRGGCYLYVEGHYCLNAEAYVRCGRQGYRLTPYARQHIDECCIAFRVQGRLAGAAYEDGRAARKREVRNRYSSRHSFAAEPETAARRQENTCFSEDAQVWAALKRAMPDSIGEAVQVILDVKGITQMELAMRLGVSRTAWRKWCARGMSLRHVTAICIALELRADVGLELVRLAGLNFRRTREDDILQGMLFEKSKLTVARANEIMRQENLPPLTQGQDEELAC